MLIFDSFMI